MLCDKHGIGGDSDDFGDNHAQLGRINVFYHEASGGKYVPRAVFFEPGVIGAVYVSPLAELFHQENLVNHTRRQNWAKGHFRRVENQFLRPPTTKGLSASSSHPPPPLPRPVV
jgi:tubulin beta